MDSSESCHNCQCLSKVVAECKQRIEELEAEQVRRDEDVKWKMTSLEVDWEQERLHLQTQLQFAQNRLAQTKQDEQQRPEVVEKVIHRREEESQKETEVLSFNQGWGSYKEQLDIAEQTNLCLSIDVSELNAQVTSLKEHIRMLQFSHNQHVSAGMTRKTGGGRTVEEWPHTTTPMGGWATPGGDPGDQADIDSDMSDQESDDDTECEFSGDSSGVGSFSDISLPSERSVHEAGKGSTPRTGSPVLPTSSPSFVMNGEKWTQVEVKHEQEDTQIAALVDGNEDLIDASEDINVEMI